MLKELNNGQDVELLKIRGLKKKFKGVPALCGVDLSVNSGEIVCIIGPSGCGKSTLLRSINYLSEPDEGEIYLNGTPVKPERTGIFKNDARLNQQRAKIGMVFQSFNLWPHLPVIANLTLAPIKVLGCPAEEADKRARELLEKVGLSAKARALPSQLSGGQQQRVGIARALAMNPSLLLFDEPTSALDPELVQEVLNVMLDLAAEKKTMIVVTHEMKFAEKVADRIIFMDGGKILEQGPPQSLLRDPKCDRLASFLNLVG